MLPSFISRHPPIRVAIVGALALACGLIVAGSAASTGFASGTPSSGGSSLPASVAAKRIAADTAPFKVAGTIVSSSDLGVRVFISSEKGFALAGVSGTTYPAATVDGGAVWRIDGPHLHVSAANAPAVVADVGAVGPATYLAYGGGMVVDVTSNAGATWWQAYMPGEALAVVSSQASGHTTLIAIVETNPARFAAYVSSDGGRHWSHTTSFV
jgi:hypothetical protein